MSIKTTIYTGTSFPRQGRKGWSRSGLGETKYGTGGVDQVNLDSRFDVLPDLSLPG